MAASRAEGPPEVRAAAGDPDSKGLCEAPAAASTLGPAVRNASPPPQQPVCLLACTPTPSGLRGCRHGGWPPLPVRLAGRPYVWPEEPEPLSPLSLP